MKKYTYLILLILLASTLTAGCASDTEGSDVKEVKTDVSSAAENAQQEQTTTPVKGSFENPAGIGETVVLTSTGNTYEISVSEVLRGEQANYIVKKENEFNENPATGYEYLLVKMKVAYTKGSGPTSMSDFNFKAFCDGVECKSTYAVLPNDYITFGTGDVMPGATKEGWVQYTVPQDKEVILSYQPNMFDDGTAYISIGQ